MVSRKEVSDLFRWLVNEDRIGNHGAGPLKGRLLESEIDDICDFISDPDSVFWQDEWKQFQEATQPAFGIGTQPCLQG